MVVGFESQSGFVFTQCVVPVEWSGAATLGGRGSRGRRQVTARSAAGEALDSSPVRQHHGQHAGHDVHRGTGTLRAWPQGHGGGAGQRRPGYKSYTKADPLNPRVLRLTRLNHPLNHVAWSSVTASAGRAPVSAGSRGKGEGSGEAIVWLVVGFCVVDFWWCSL